MTPDSPAPYAAAHAALQHDRAGVLIPADPHGRLRNTARLVTAEGEQTVICSAPSRPGACVGTYGASVSTCFRCRTVI